MGWSIRGGEKLRQWAANLSALRGRWTGEKMATSKAAGDHRETIRGIAAIDHRDSLAIGLDRHGRPFRPLAESTWKRRKGGGPPLVPMGEASRFAKHYRNKWTQSGKQATMVNWIEPIFSKAGRDIVPFHLLGGRRLPRREALGLRPNGIARVRATAPGFLRVVTQDMVKGNV